MKLGLMSRCFMLPQTYIATRASSSAPQDSPLRSHCWAARRHQNDWHDLVLVETANPSWAKPPNPGFAQGKRDGPAIDPIFSSINWGWFKHVKSLWIMGCWPVFSTGDSDFAGPSTVCLTIVDNRNLYLWENLIKNREIWDCTILGQTPNLGFVWTWGTR